MASSTVCANAPQWSSFLALACTVFSWLDSSRILTLSGRGACKGFQLATASDDGTSVWRTTFYDTGTHVVDSNLYQSIHTISLPAFCRVQLRVVTNATAGSHANTEVWLPEKSSWNGRFLALGNGGLAGGVALRDLGWDAVDRGFAGMSTDMGHNSTAYDGKWGGPHNDNSITDLGWRAMHLSVAAAKQVVREYYGHEASKSYYSGCSMGGRSGMVEIQRFPDDFDGALIGAPASWASHLQAWSYHTQNQLLPVGSARWISTSMWTVIHKEVLRQCDELDGIADGIIGDPLSCRFDPEAIACAPSQDPSTCLNTAQITSLKTIYADYVEVNNTFIFSGLYPGGEEENSRGVAGAFQFSPDYFRYMVFNDTEWDPTTLDLPQILLADQLDPGQMIAIDPDLTRFTGPDNHSKVIHYIGWSDAMISAGDSLRYYESVDKFTRAHTSMNTDDFYRLFTVPGMAHCGRGFGANGFGATSHRAIGTPPLSNSPEHDILSALIAWVEDGRAPETIVAAAYHNNSASQGLAFTRPLCKYPRKIQYVTGDPDDTSSFTCVE